MLKLLVVVVLIGVVIYLGIRLLDRRGRLDEGGSTAERGPVGPEDDPDFLRDLERRRRDERDG